MRGNNHKKGIFCLEGVWNSDLSKPSTVRPILDLLRIQVGIPFIYRDCATRDEFAYFLKKWVQRTYDNFPILYLASHGKEFSICLGNYTCDLVELAKLLGKKCRNRIVICGGCNTLDVHKSLLKHFLEDTGALAICGYRLAVDWLQATAFELLLMEAVQDKEFSKRGLPAIQSSMQKVAKPFKGLQFRIVTCKELT